MAYLISTPIPPVGEAEEYPFKVDYVRSRSIDTDFLLRRIQLEYHKETERGCEADGHTARVPWKGIMVFGTSKKVFSVFRSLKSLTVLLQFMTFKDYIQGGCVSNVQAN